MPPPSSIPDSLHRQNYAYASAPRVPDRWPLAPTEDQRQLQEQFRQQAQAPQINPNYHQPSPITTAPPSGPVSSFPPPPPKTRSPPQTQAPAKSRQGSQNPQAASKESQKSQEQMATTAAKSAAQTNPAAGPQASDSTKAKSESTASPSLESRRVTALLDLNRVLIEEVMAVQAAKAKESNPQPQQNAQKTTSPPAGEVKDSPAGANATSDAGAPTKEAGDKSNNDKQSNNPSTTTSNSNEGSKKSPPNTNDQPPTQAQQQQASNAKVLASKEYIEYMRRLQANLAYLASVADRNHKPGNVVPPFPNIMEAPNLPNVSKGAESGAKTEGGGGNDLKKMYRELRELWP
ncbi:MAG: hypothetical protein Q9174_003759, partial [Haloplaca sp. 1 TL-2023]